MNDTVGFIFISASKRYLFKLVCFQHSNLMQSVSSTFDKNFDPWILWISDICSVLKFWEFKIEVYVEVDASVVSIRILRCIGWTGLLRWFEDVSCSVVLPVRFSWGSGLLEYWIRLYVRSRWFGCSLRLGMPFKLACQKAVFIFPGHWRATTVVLQDECLTSSRTRTEWDVQSERGRARGESVCSRARSSPESG